jgi:hypothetical protein
MPFSYSAYGRIARHLAQRFDVLGQEQRAATHAGGHECRLGSGMAATDDDNIKFFRKLRHLPRPAYGWIILGFEMRRRSIGHWGFRGFT